MARWLERLASPAVRVWAHSPDVVETAEGLVAFWVKISCVRPGSPAELSGLLRRLHTIRPGPDGVLEPFEPFERVCVHVHHAAGTSSRGAS
ncbi:MAG: hypothetical protein ACFCUP_13655 [Actinomycetales bacterium]